MLLPCSCASVCAAFGAACSNEPQFGPTVCGRPGHCANPIQVRQYRGRPVATKAEGGGGSLALARRSRHSAREAVKPRRRPRARVFFAPLILLTFSAPCSERRRVVRLFAVGRGKLPPKRDGAGRASLRGLQASARLAKIASSSAIFRRASSISSIVPRGRGVGAAILSSVPMWTKTCCPRRIGSTAAAIMKRGIFRSSVSSSTSGKATVTTRTSSGC